MIPPPIIVISFDSESKRQSSLSFIDLRFESSISSHRYAKNFEGKSFWDICRWFGCRRLSDQRKDGFARLKWKSAAALWLHRVNVVYHLALHVESGVCKGMLSGTRCFVEIAGQSFNRADSSEIQFTWPRLQHLSQWWRTAPGALGISSDGRSERQYPE